LPRRVERPRVGRHWLRLRRGNEGVSRCGENRERGPRGGVTRKDGQVIRHEVSNLFADMQMNEGYTAGRGETF